MSDALPPPPNSNRVTLRQMAEALQVSTQAVSLALRGRRGVSEATRQRVQALAAAWGYVPDPGLRALAEYRTRTAVRASRWHEVALLHNWPTEAGLFRDPFYAVWFRELVAAAGLKGVRVVPFWLGVEGKRTAAVFRALRNRGITGIFLAPPALTADPPVMRLPREGFQMVTFGPEQLYPDLHTVQFDFYENLRLAWRVLRERGRRRIGLVYARHQGWRTGHAWRAAFLVEQLLCGCAPGERMPLELSGSAAEQRLAYRIWLRRGRYDGVISSVPWVAGVCAGVVAAPEVALFHVMDTGMQGIDLNLRQMARTAVELLQLEMQRSLVKEQALPFRVHIPGRWVEGRG